MQSFFLGTFAGIRQFDVEPGKSKHHVLRTPLKRGQEICELDQKK
jgi:hypothetical protein